VLLERKEKKGGGTHFNYQGEKKSVFSSGLVMKEGGFSNNDKTGRR